MRENADFFGVFRDALCLSPILTGTVLRETTTSGENLIMTILQVAMTFTVFLLLLAGRKLGLIPL